jgi:RNA methyltransferase, TrmH family
MLLKSQVKYIQSLGQKKFRDAEGLFIAEGPKIVNELLQSGLVEPLYLFALRDWINVFHGLSTSLPPKQLFEISELELGRISHLTTPNQILGVFKKPAFAEASLNGRVSLLLDNIQDPGNLGTIIRIADWFAISTIICCETSVDAFNPKVVQGSMGSIVRVQVFYDDLELIITNHPQLPVYATSLTGQNLYDMRPLEEGLIIIGNESRGISPSLLSRSHQQISIPRKGQAESLNAAVATGIILSHLIT